MDTQNTEISVELLEKALEYERRKRRRRARWGWVLLSLLLVAAAAVLIGMRTLTVLRVSGDAMADTLRDGDVVVGLRLADYRRGDVIAFSRDGGLLIKRLIAEGGDWVEMDADGYIFVNGTRLRETYVTEIARGSSDIPFPLTVPQGTCFVLGDNRPVSVDSRSSALGSIPAEAILGRLLWRAWPFARIGVVR